VIEVNLLAVVAEGDEGRAILLKVVDVDDHKPDKEAFFIFVPALLYRKQLLALVVAGIRKKLPVDKISIDYQCFSRREYVNFKGLIIKGHVLLFEYLLEMLLVPNLVRIFEHQVLLVQHHKQIIIMGLSYC
jgi:hypothetical protein